MTSNLTDELREAAHRQGFLSMAVTGAEPDLEARRIALGRVAEGSFSGLSWFHAERVARATDPAVTLPGARSVVLFAASYRHERSAPADGGLRGRIARYAWGRDYHNVLEKRARPLLRLLAERSPGSRSRFLVDHGPLMERAYARAAGLGWQGKNTMLLARGVGSFTFLAAILTTVELDSDRPVAQTCGACTRCLPSCPTGAIRSEYEVVNDLCIAYQTIENRGVIPRPIRRSIGDWVFGCDLCQESCPVNDSSGPEGLPEFDAREPDDAWPELVAILSLGEEDFRRRFAGRPVLRARYPGLLRNACIALGNLGDVRAVPALAGALAHREPLVR
ncbi:MAG: tRNA epoxyqueuosine(34) reductase QueG, partial [Candidatus Binatia bacterium]